MTNPYIDYSLENLMSMKANIEAAIDEKKRQAYEEALQKVIEALKVMADNYPYEEVYGTDDYEYVTWKDLYSGILSSVQAPPRRQMAGRGVTPITPPFSFLQPSY